MTDKAKLCIGWVLRREGGYVNDPDDPGKETAFGISKRSYPHVDIASLNPERAAEIYHRDFWEPIHGDELDSSLALAMLDYAVHSGPTRAIRELAVALGLPRDTGINQVIRSLVPVPCQRSVALNLIVERAIFLVRRALTAPRQDKYAKGWISRMVELKHAVEAA